MTIQKEKAILDYLSGTLLVTGTNPYFGVTFLRLLDSFQSRVAGTEDMSVMMCGIQMLARESTQLRMMDGWKIFCSILPKMRPSRETAAKFVAYFEKIWLSAKYAGTWPDWGRVLHDVEEMTTTNDGLEKWWQELKKVASMDRILKRPDEFLERVGGYGLFGISQCPSVMGMVALDHRDRNSRGWAPRITTEVRRRHHLANCILIAGAITELIPSKVCKYNSNLQQP